MRLNPRQLLDSERGKYALTGFVLLLALSIGAVSEFAGDSAPEYNAKRQSGGAPTSMDLAASMGAAGTQVEADSQSRKRATRYDIDLEVPDVQEAISETETLVSDYAGVVESTSFSRETGTSGRIDVRVPEENASKFLSELEDRWRIESRNRNVDDVTDRYTELELELRNKRQELQQLERLMNRTNNTSDLIKIQERMSELRSRIQFLDSQLENLDQRVEYTHFSISFEEPQIFETGFELRNSLRDAYRAIFTSFNLIIVGLGYIVPFLLIGVIIYKGRKLVERLQ